MSSNNYCMDCGLDLLTDEELETGLCETCYDMRLADEKDERRNPDE